MAVEAVLGKLADVTTRKLVDVTTRISANVTTQKSDATMRKPANATTTRSTTNVSPTKLINVTTKKSVNKMTKKSANITTEGVKTKMSQFIQPQETWIIDSGASSHMCKDAKRFENFKPVTGSIGGADGKAIAITGEGRVRILTKDSMGDDRTLVLERVLLIPTLEYNLFSIRAIAEKGHRAVFEEHGG